MPSSTLASGEHVRTALEQAGALACEIIDTARGSLMLSLRFMDVALWRMPLAARYMACASGTDGYRFYYDAVQLLHRYRRTPNEVVRDYVHAILHCVFHHPFDGKHGRYELWDVACDIAVEACALELVGLRHPCKLDDERRRALKRLEEECGQLTAQKIYRYEMNREQTAAEGRDVVAEFVERMQPLFGRDDHEVWTRTPERPDRHLKVDTDTDLINIDTGQRLKGDDELDEDDGEDEKQNASSLMDGSPAKSGSNQAALGDVENGDRFSDMAATDEAEPMFESMAGVEVGDFEGIEWTDISSIIETELEAFTAKIGSDAGNFLVNLSVANRKVLDYSDFLRRFSARSEEIKVSPDEFDYIYYTYGLNLYKNMPLIEPLEYQETNRVRDFVIAIDTSASCAGGLIQRFVEKTYDVLKSESGFGKKMNVHVVQCDSEVRKVTKITEASRVDDTFIELETRGYGGTDFRPVFKYVDELIEKREFTNLKGLIYLTDGLGKYPESPPDYDVAFVFMTQTDGQRRVPPWAMKVVMDEDRILEL